MLTPNKRITLYTVYIHTYIHTYICVCVCIYIYLTSLHRKRQRAEMVLVTRSFGGLSDILFVWWRYFHPGSHLKRQCLGQPVGSALALHPGFSCHHAHVNAHCQSPWTTTGVWLWCMCYKKETGSSLVGAPLPAYHLQLKLFKWTPCPHLSCDAQPECIITLNRLLRLPGGKTPREQEKRRRAILM